MSPITVITSVWMPEYARPKGWRRVAAWFGVPVRREIAVFHLPTQNAYIVNPASRDRFLKVLRQLSIPFQAGQLKVVT